MSRKMLSHGGWDQVDDSADRYAGSRKKSHCTFVDVLPALVAVVGRIRGVCVRHGDACAAWGGACNVT